MTLTPIQLAELRAADGLATAEDLALLAESGATPMDGTPLRAALRDALAAPEPLDLAPRVMDRLGLSTAGGGGLGDALRDALDPGELPDLADPVLDALGLGDARVGDRLRAALAPPADLDVADAVLDRLGLGDSAVVPLPTTRHTRTTPVGYLGLASAAAAVLLAVFAGPVAGPTAGEFAFELSPVNHLEIEELSTETGGMVQVLQFEPDAPTIIFIDDPSTPDEGATL